MQLFHELWKKFKCCIWNRWDIIIVKFLKEITHSTKLKVNRFCPNTISTWLKFAVVVSGSSMYLYLICFTNSRDIHVAILLLWSCLKMKLCKLCKPFFSIDYHKRTYVVPLSNLITLISHNYFSSIIQKPLMVYLTSLKLGIPFPQALDVYLEVPKSTVLEQGLKLLKVHLPECKSVAVVDSRDTLQGCWRKQFNGQWLRNVIRRPIH